MKDTHCIHTSYNLFVNNDPDHESYLPKISIYIRIINVLILNRMIFCLFVFFRPSFRPSLRLQLVLPVPEDECHEEGYLNGFTFMTPEKETVTFVYLVV